MTTEEHMATAETHLRYTEGHLQPSEKHLADAEVHLKLVKAHLAILEPAGQAEVQLMEIVGCPPGEPRRHPTTVRKAPTKKAKAVSESKKENPAEEGVECSSTGVEMRSPPGEDERWMCPIDECPEVAAHTLDDCKGFGDLSVT